MGRGSPHDSYQFQTCGHFVCDAYGRSLGLHPSLRNRFDSPARERIPQEAPLGSPYPTDLSTVPDPSANLPDPVPPAAEEAPAAIAPDAPTEEA